MEEAAKKCFEEITSQPKHPLFVAVAGDSGSGKSYLVSLLEEHFQKASLSYTLINHDDFLIARKDREPMKTIIYNEGKFKGKSRWEILENMFRLDEYERVINELSAGITASYIPYTRATGELETTPRIVKSSDYVIFDTSMMLDKMDFVIMVDVTQENIIKRKLIRDIDIRTPKQITEMHMRVQGYYWTDRGKPDSADIVIDNNDFANVKVKIYK